MQETSLGLLLVPGDEVLVRFELRLLRIRSRCFAPRNTLNAKLRNPPDGAVVQGVHGIERCNNHRVITDPRVEKLVRGNNPGRGRSRGLALALTHLLCKIPVSYTHLTLPTKRIV